MTVTLKADPVVLVEKINEAIERGDGLASESGEVAVFKSAYQTWDKRNEILLEEAFETDGFLTVSPANEYTSALGLKYPLGPDLAEHLNLPDLISDLRTKLQRLRNFLGTLDAYSSSASSSVATGTGADIQPTVFIVHGRDLVARGDVELLIHRATSIKPVILASQLNTGATIIEKLEKHLGGATFAVVLLTGEDVGRLDEPGEKDQRRARQNVILELGFAMGALGRSNVAILHEEGLDLPSDINGVGYYPLDSEGHWKMSILGELQAAGFAIDLRHGAGS